MRQPYVPQEGVQRIVSDLRLEIDRINQRLQTSGLLGVVVERLQMSSNTLQKELERILSKGNLLTEAEYNEAYEKLRKERRSVLEQSYKRTSRFFLVLGIVTAVAVGYITYKKLKK